MKEKLLSMAEFKYEWLTIIILVLFILGAIVGTGSLSIGFALLGSATLVYYISYVDDHYM